MSYPPPRPKPIVVIERKPSSDFAYCNGQTGKMQMASFQIDNGYCPNRSSCARYTLMNKEELQDLGDIHHFCWVDARMCAKHLFKLYLKG